MPRAFHPPLVNELHAAPELAVLAALEATADVAVRALVAAHPEIQDHAQDESDEIRQAIAILHATSTLASAINRYRLALALAKRHFDHWPF